MTDLGWIITGGFFVLGLMDSTVVAAAAQDPDISKTTIALLSALTGGIGLEIVKQIFARMRAREDHELKDETQLRKDLLTETRTLREELRTVQQELLSSQQNYFALLKEETKTSIRHDNLTVDHERLEVKYNELELKLRRLQDALRDEDEHEELTYQMREASEAMETLKEGRLRFNKERMRLEEASLASQDTEPEAK